MAAPVESNVEVQHGIINKGKALFAVRDIKKGDILFEEEPLVACQFLWNALYKYLACDHCLKSIETAENAARRLCANPSLVLPHPECCTVKPEEHTVCPHCQVSYCSEACRQKAWQQHHEVLCLGPSVNDDCTPLNRLQEVWRNIHYPPETASITLLVRMIATVKQSKDKATTIGIFNEFCKSVENREQEIALKLLGKEFQDQLDLLAGMMPEVVVEESVSQWLTPQGFRSMFALVGENGQGIGTSSISVWAKNCDDLTLPEEEASKLDKFIDQLYEDLDKESGTFLNCEGSGLYRLQSTCNHSCEPNAEVTFPHNNFVLALQALEDIPAGEEICISYLDDHCLHSSRHTRQKMLRENYLFTCQCPKCLAQADDPDVTSEEEEEDMEEDN